MFQLTVSRTSRALATISGIVASALILATLGSGVALANDRSSTQGDFGDNGIVLRGTVTGGSPAGPVEGIGVQVTGRYGGATDIAVTDAHGRYEVTALPGSGFVNFIGNDEFASEWYKDVPDFGSATVLNFSADRVLNARLTAAGSISGIVRGPVELGSSVVPLPDSQVTLSTRTGSYITDVFTGDDGRYTFPALAAGAYRISFTGPGGSEYWKPDFYGDAERISLSKVITLRAGVDLKTANATLAPHSVISGTVFSEATGQPVVQLRVTLRTLDGTFVADRYPSDGNYSFWDVPSGSYVVQAWGGQNEAVTYYGGGASPSTATPIVVKRGTSVRGIDITRPAGARLEGTISAAGLSTAGTRAVLLTEGGEEVASAYVYHDAYTLSAVKAGSYLVKFVPPAGRLIGGWWKDSGSRVTATPVALVAGETTELGEAQLAVYAPGSIAGHVTGGAGTEVGIEGPGLDSGVPQTAVVDENGNYVFTDLAPGKFQLYFANGQHLDGTFGDAQSAPVVVRAGQTTTAASVTIKTLVPVKISATGSGKPVSVYATFYGLDGVRITDGFFSGDEESDPMMIPRGRYKVLFTPAGDERKRGLVWLGNKSSFSSSVTLDLRTKKSATIGAKLPVASTFTAKIVDNAKKRPLSDINVKVWERQPDGQYLDRDFSAASDSTGTFTLRGLGAGTYKFQLVDLTYRAYRTTWFGGTSLSSARAVKIGLTPSHLKSSSAIRLVPSTGRVGVATPSISGTVAVGSTLTAKTALVWPSTGVKKTYSWLRDGAAIAGATSSSYTLKSADAGKEITVRITGSKTGYSTSSTVSLPKNTLG